MKRGSCLHNFTAKLWNKCVQRILLESDLTTKCLNTGRRRKEGESLIIKVSNLRWEYTFFNSAVTFVMPFECLVLERVLSFVNRRKRTYEEVGLYQHKFFLRRRKLQELFYLALPVFMDPGSLICLWVLRVVYWVPYLSCILREQLSRCMAIVNSFSKTVHSF